MDTLPLAQGGYGDLIEVYNCQWICAAIGLLFLAAVGRVFWVQMRPKRPVLSKAQGKCLHCGYDLRATPDRCPECNTLAPNPPEISQAAESLHRSLQTSPNPSPTPPPT